MKNKFSFSGARIRWIFALFIVPMTMMAPSCMNDTSKNFATKADAAAVVCDIGVPVLPGSSVDQMIVEEVNGKMMAANQESSVDIMAAANQKEESIYLQAAVVPPLIAQRNSNMKVYGIQSSSDQNSLMIPIATMEVSNIGYVVTSANLMGWQFTGRNEKRVTEQLSLIPEVQVKRMIVDNATANSDPYEKASLKTSATTKADLNLLTANESPHVYIDNTLVEFVAVTETKCSPENSKVVKT